MKFGGGDLSRGKQTREGQKRRRDEKDNEFQKWKRASKLPMVGRNVVLRAGDDKVSCAG